MKAFKGLISAVVVVAGLGLASGALAHEGHDHSAAKHDHTPVAGGIVAEVGDYDVELVAADGKTSLLLKDHDGNEQAADGFKASVLVLSGAKRAGPFELAPAGGNKLEGEGVALKSGDKAILTLTDKAGKTAQGRYQAQ